MRRSNHYEAAFEDLLRAKGLPYVAVDETKRALFASARLKSFDFLVYLPDRPNLLVDVKGRKARGGRRAWSFDAWVGREDLDALKRWEEVFGPGFSAVLVFAFELANLEHVSLFEAYHFRGGYYRFFLLSLADYLAHCRPRSAKWRTSVVPRAVFRRLAVDFADLADGGPALGPPGGPRDPHPAK